MIAPVRGRLADQGIACMSIDVDGLYRVKPGETYAFTDETGSLLAGAAPQLVSAARIGFTQPSADNDLAAINANVDGAEFWNRVGGRVLVDTTSSAVAQSLPIVMVGADDLLRNGGAVTIRGDDLPGMMADA